jgi:hypothetical protein
VSAEQWQAVLIEGGNVLAWDDFDGNYVAGLEEDVRIEIVRGTAAPEDNGRMPGTYEAADVAVEFGDFDSYEEVEQQWSRAVAMAAGLNQVGAA